MAVFPGGDANGGRPPGGPEVFRLDEGSDGTASEGLCPREEDCTLLSDELGEFRIYGADSDCGSDAADGHGVDELKDLYEFNPMDLAPIRAASRPPTPSGVPSGRRKVVAACERQPRRGGAHRLLGRALDGVRREAVAGAPTERSRCTGEAPLRGRDGGHGQEAPAARPPVGPPVSSTSPAVSSKPPASCDGRTRRAAGGG